MWVADMDFETVPEVVEALKKRVEHGIFGYSIMPDAVVKAAHFIPTYWYTMALEEVAYMTKVTPEFLREFSMDVLVEVVFAFTMLSAGLLLSKRRRVVS